MVFKYFAISIFLLLLVQGIGVVNTSKPVKAVKTRHFEGLSPDFKCNRSDLPKDVIDILVKNKIALDRQAARRAPERHHNLSGDLVFMKREQTELDLNIKHRDGREHDVAIVWETDTIDVMQIPATSHIPNESPMTSPQDYLRAGIKLYRAGDVICAFHALRKCLRLSMDNVACQQWHEQIRKVGKSIAMAQRALHKHNYRQCITATQRILALENEEPMIIFQALRLQCTCLALHDKNARALPICGKTLSIKVDRKVYKSRATAFKGLGLYGLANQDLERATVLSFKTINLSEEEAGGDVLLY